MRVILNATLLSSGGVARTLMHGTRASWAKYGPDLQEQQLVEGIVAPGTAGFGDDHDPGILMDGETAERTAFPVPHSDQIGYYRGIRDAILGLAPLPVSAESAIGVMGVLETSFASAEKGILLPLSLTAEERDAFHGKEPGVQRSPAVTS
jgi:hypothetical protein